MSTCPRQAEQPLRNTYWLLRHGRSLANEAGVVVSLVENGVDPQWRLADEGRRQAVDAGKLLAQHLDGASERLLVVTSPFSRTVETAELAAAQLHVTPGMGPQAWQVDDCLVERSFGMSNELRPTEGTAHTYAATWERDAHDVDHRPGGDGESLAMVAARLARLFQRLEAGHQDRHILLVSHGDTLSICQAAMTPGPHTLHGHRQFAFQTAQLKRLN